MEQKTTQLRMAIDPKIKDLNFMLDHMGVTVGLICDAVPMQGQPVATSYQKLIVFVYSTPLLKFCNFKTNDSFWRVNGSGGKVFEITTEDVTELS